LSPPESKKRASLLLRNLLASAVLVKGEELVLELSRAAA
jgi:hypothetical protein